MEKGKSIPITEFSNIGNIIATLAKSIKKKIEKNTFKSYQKTTRITENTKLFTENRRMKEKFNKPTRQIYLLRMTDFLFSDFQQFSLNKFHKQN